MYRESEKTCFLEPSPDWFVGISGLALCDDKCNWTQQKTLDLYPYDLGLYADLKYEVGDLFTKYN